MVMASISCSNAQKKEFSKEALDEKLTTPDNTEITFKEIIEKHKGKTVEEVFRTEPSYYDWMQNGMFPLYTKKKLTELRFKLFNKKI